MPKTIIGNPTKDDSLNSKKNILVKKKWHPANFFGFKKLNTNWNNEIRGGLVSLLAIVYILGLQMELLGGFVKPTPSLDNQHFSKGGIFIATALAGIIGCLVMGFVGKSPFVAAPGIGVSVIIANNFANKGMGWQGAIIAVLFSTWILLFLTISRVRLFLLQAIPDDLKKVIAIGIGFFIAYIGFKDLGFFDLTKSEEPIARFQPKLAEPQFFVPILLGLLVLGIAIVGYFFKIKANILLAIGIGLLLAVFLANVIPSDKKVLPKARWHGWDYDDFSGFSKNINSVFDNFGSHRIWSTPTFYLAIFIIVFVDFFDATGTIFTFQQQIKTLDQELEVETTYPLGRILMADAGTSLANGFIGVSNSTVFIESGAGIAEGARSGFANLVTAVGIGVAIVLYPLFKLIPPCVTGAVLIFVGFLIAQQLKGIDWTAPENVIAGFAMVLLSVTTFGITIALGLTFWLYTLVCCLQPARRHRIKPSLLVLDGLFLVYYILLAFV